MNGPNPQVPKVSVVIVARTAGAADVAIGAAKRLDWPSELLEIILAIGAHPSVQRNEAAAGATGDYVLFLDNDSEVSADLLRKYLDAIRRFPEAAVYGGPSLYRVGTAEFQDSVQLLFSSWFALGPVRARYQPLGELRLASERELILCNLLVRKEVIGRDGGFDSRLYPNEENEFLNRLIRDHQKAVYHPDAGVYREPRRNWVEFVRQMFNYGRGRFRHYRIRPGFFDVIFAVPSVFVLYLLFLPWMIAALSGRVWWLTPLGLHAAMSLFVAWSSWRRGASLRAALRLPALVFSCHVFYGVGFLSEALFPNIRPLRGDVRLIQAKTFAGGESL